MKNMRSSIKHEGIEKFTENYIRPMMIPSQPKSIPQEITYTNHEVMNDCEFFQNHLKKCKSCESKYLYNNFYNSLLETITYILTGIMFLFILDIITNKMKK